MSGAGHLNGHCGTVRDTKGTLPDHTLHGHRDRTGKDCGVESWMHRWSTAVYEFILEIPQSGRGGLNQR
jgi:hypothetical protein